MDVGAVLPHALLRKKQKGAHDHDKRLHIMYLRAHADGARRGWGLVPP
jgi:hypothetical protein